MLSSFNGFLDKKYSPLVRSMNKKYKPSPRPMLTTPEEKTNQFRKNIRIGSTVLVAEKINYYNGTLTRGRVIKILTPRAFHPRGIKVLLDNGKVGRVQKILVF